MRNLNLFNTVPEFGRLARLLQIVVDSSLQGINFSLLISNDKEQYNAECVKIVEMMIDKKLFRKGRDFSKEVGLCQDRITMAEVCNKNFIECHMYKTFL